MRLDRADKVVLGVVTALVLGMAALLFVEIRAANSFCASYFPEADRFDCVMTDRFRIERQR